MCVGGGGGLFVLFCFWSLSVEITGFPQLKETDPCINQSIEVNQGEESVDFSQTFLNLFSEMSR